MKNILIVCLLAAVLLPCVLGVGDIMRVKLAEDLKYMKAHPMKTSNRPARGTITLPDNWDWRNMSGVNYCTPPMNQRSPTFCGCCWGMASIHSLADRIKIARSAAWPDFELSVQDVLNCGPWDCTTGASVSQVLAYLVSHGTTDNTCMQFTGQALDCSAINECRYCYHEDSLKCAAVPEGDFMRFRAASYGWETIRETTNIAEMVEDMMTEIYINGPIVGLMDMDGIEDYTGGIYTNTSAPRILDHVVEIAGWGTDPDTGMGYWIILNSMGTYWGDYGWVYIEQGKDIVGIEQIFGYLVPENTWD